MQTVKVHEEGSNERTVRRDDHFPLFSCSRRTETSTRSLGLIDKSRVVFDIRIRQAPSSQKEFLAPLTARGKGCEEHELSGG